MKILNFILIAAFGLLINQAVVAQKQLLDKVVAQVGSEFVLLSDVEARLSYIRDNYGEVDETTRCYVLQDILAQKLLVNQAKLDSIVVSDEEVTSQIDSRIDRILTAMGNDEQKFIDYYGKSVDDVRKEQREILENQLFSDKMRAQVMSNVSATPSEVIEMFSSIPIDSLPYFNSEVEISEMVYKVKPSKAEIEKAKNAITEIKDKILTGVVEFEKAASIYSDDPGSGEKGGDLGWQKRGTFVSEFEGAAFNLKIGEYSEIIESEFGFHFIQLLERRGNLIHTRHILVRPEIKPDDLTIAENLLDSLKFLVEADSMSFAFLVKKYGDDKQQSYNNAGRMTNPNTGTTFFEIGDLESDVFFAIDKVDVNELTEAVVFDEFGNEPFYKIFKLTARSKPHQASLEEDYPKIQNMAAERKQNQMFNDWLFRKIKSTYVKIDPIFLDCEEVDIWLEEKAF